MNKPPDSTEPAQLVRETDDRPVVRDDGHNPVVRKLDLIEYVQPIRDIQRDMKIEGRVGMSLLGIVTVVAGNPSGALKVGTAVLTPGVAFVRAFLNI